MNRAWRGLPLPSLLIVLLLLLVLPAGRALALPGPAPCVEPGEASLDAAALMPALRLHIDRAAELAPEAVLRLPEAAWAPLRPADLSPGYSASAFWLRLCLSSPQAVQRWLLLRPARLESVRLYAQTHDAQGRPGPLLARRAGTEQAFGLRELPLRESAFALQLGPQPQTLWLRVASRSAVALDLSLWRPADLLREEQARLWGDGLLIGLAVLLLLAALLLGLAGREPAYAYLALYLGAFVCYESGMRGSAFMLFWPQATDWAVRALGSFGVLAHLFQLAALSRLLDTARLQPRLHRLMWGLAAVDGLVLGLCIWGDYRSATQLAGLFNGSLGLLMGLACWQAVRQRRPLAWAWGAALILNGLGMLPRVLSLLGWQAHSALVDYGPPLLGLAGVLLVLLAMAQRMRRRRLRHEQELEEAVRQRTAELAAASAQAQASDAAKGRLLGYLGHDLRAPLASVVQLTRQLRPDEGFEADRLAIEHSSQLLLEMIDELQRFARAPQASAAPELLPAPVYVHGLLLELDQQAQALVRSGGNRLLLHRDPSLPAVLELDARRLRQCLFNLLSNAAKFNRAGLIQLSASYRSGRLCLSVEDDGPGIAEADQALVFEPFMRAASSQNLPGLGLGLSIARQTVLAMGGSIVLHSRPGEGCRFELSLPTARAEESQVAWPTLRQLAPEAEDPGAASRLALVLDGCAAVREVLVERLALAGYDCLQAESLAQALALDPGPQAPDLLLVEPLSLGEPGRAGLDALRARFPAAALLCCSARPEPGDALYKPAPELLWWPALSARTCRPGR